MANEERIPAEILKKVRRIELSTRHLVDDMFGGEYHSVFKGTGMEFDEVREYFPGDDVRSIDWNVTARMGRPFIKRYKEERELTVMLVVDASASGLFGSRERLKSEIIAEVASVLAFSAIRNQDKVGCLIFTDRTEKYIPPEKGHRHVLRIIRELLYFKPEGTGTDIGKALETITHLQRRKAVVFLLSDFFDEGYETALRLAAGRHDLIAFNIFDPLEAEIPDVGLLHVRDAETGQEHWLDTSSKWVRKHFGEEAAERRENLRQLLGRHGVDHIPLDVTGDTIVPLVRFFKQRMKRLSRGAGKRTGALLIAGLLAFGSGSALAQQRQQQPTIQPAPPPGQSQPGLPPGPMGAPGQMAPGQMPPGMGQEAPSIPFTPRSVLDELDLPTLADLTAASRPRLEERSAEGISASARLAMDIQTIGERNALSWRVILLNGAELLPLSPDLGEPGRLQPLPRLTASGEVETELIERMQAGGEVTLLDFLSADTIRSAAGDTLDYRLEFTTFQPDSFEIPPQTLAYRLPGEKEQRSLQFPAMQLTCVSTLAASPDSAAMRDWKSPGELRGDWLPVLTKWGIPGILALALLAWLAVWMLRRRAAAGYEIPIIPPHVEALQALEALAAQDLPGQGAFHNYYFRLSLIVRRYLGRRFALPFNDWTTEEIKGALLPPAQRLHLAADLSNPLLEDLSLADMVKFARRKPSREECDASLKASRHLIHATKAIEESAAAAAPIADAVPGSEAEAKS